MNSLHDLRVLITGASRGLGAALAEKMWEEGASLLLVARSAESLAALQTSLRSKARTGQTVNVFAVDLGRETAVAEVVERTRSLWSGVDVLVNNAAMLGPLGKLWTNDWPQWEATLRLNLIVPVELCRACVPGMIAQHYGRIINLSGGGATGPRPHFSAYATAKAALVRFSETLAEELQPTPVAVNCIAPGAMNTQMLEAVLQSPAEMVGEAEFAAATQQKERGGAPPQRAAELCAFLASPASAGISGKLLSAVWDPWEELPRHLDDLRKTDVYTLRRIVPKERGFTWGERA